MIEDTRPDPTVDTSQPVPWWQGPPPAGYTGQWPPPLPPGAQYGDAPGSIVYPNGSGGPPVIPPADPTHYGVTPPPVVTPPPTGPQTPPGGTPPPTTTLTSNNPGINPTPNPNPIPPWLPPTPTFNAPASSRPPPFAYPGFHGPSADEVTNTPGYQFRFGQGMGALENSKAAQGVIGTGGSIKDFINYGQGFASNEFNNEWNRQFSEYGANRSNALQTYNTNYQTQYVDPFNQAFQNAQATLAPQLVGYQTQVGAGLQNDSQNRLYNFNNQVFDYNKTRNTQLDAFDEWYRKFMLQLQAAGM